MKKVLFATSALVAFSGAAFAEVAVTGDARIGMVYDSAATDGKGGTTGAFNVVNRARVKFTMTGESDAGLSYGASFRADQAGKAKSNGADNMGAGHVWVSGTYGKLSAGDVDSAAESAVGDLAGVGLTGLRDFNETSYLTSDLDGGQDANMLYEYAINGVNLYASFQDGYKGLTGEKNKATGWSLGAAYEMAGYKLAIGYEKADHFYLEIPSIHDDVGITFTNTENAHNLALSAQTTFNDVTVKGIYSTTKFDVVGGQDGVKLDQVGVSGEYTMANGVALAGFYKHNKLDDVKADAIGLGAGYDLGGGATVKGGLVSYKLGERDRNVVADAGLSFKF